MRLLLDFIKRYERHISTLVFVGGFVADILSFTLLELPVVNLLFLAYIGIAALAVFISHLVGEVPETATRVRRTVATLAPLAAQFTIGGLLSGCLIFYTKSADVFVSWPFLLLLAAIFIGNEWFRDYRAHLVFQTVLFFFGLYAYLIFAFPLYVSRLGPRVFAESTAIATLIFILFVFVLALTGWQRLKQTLPHIITGTGLVLIFVILSYFTGLVPPIPLTLKESGVYQHVSRAPDGYHITYEGSRRWSRFVERTVHHQPGAPLYAFSSVFAPTSFSAGVVHRWERYDESKETWTTEAVVAFNLTGGREAGYRGYSLKNDPQPGTWKVSVETLEGQVIGTLRFTVVNTNTRPPLQSAVR